MLNRRKAILTTSAAVGTLAAQAVTAKQRPEVYPRTVEGIGSVYATEGEKVYCQSGCEIAQFGNTVRVYDDPKPGDLIATSPIKFGDWNCPHCGAPVNHGVGIYYFEKTQ